MSTPSEPARGYLSLASKRRFTVLAGLLGAAFFLAQFILPMLAMFAVMMPQMFGAMEFLDVESAVQHGGEVWVLASRLSPRWGSKSRGTTFVLKRLRTSDLTEAAPPLPLDGDGSRDQPQLLAVGPKVWLIGPRSVGVTEGGAVQRLEVARPRRASSPFVVGGRPAVITLGARAELHTLETSGGSARWEQQELAALDLPAERGGLRGLQAVEAGGGALYLFAETCTASPEHCTLSYRPAAAAEWATLREEDCSCLRWTALQLDGRPTVFVSENTGESQRPALIVIGPDGPRREPIEGDLGRRTWGRWQPLAGPSGLILLSRESFDGIRLAQVADGRVVRTVATGSGFPFPAAMLQAMVLVQALPLVLSLVLALLLTLLMRRHREPLYVVGDQHRRFATLWQRALAQLVDLVPFLAGMVPYFWVMKKMMASPEDMLGEGFPWPPIAALLAGLAWSALVLLAYSYAEGRFGRTPGKWLVGIRVLGTDLQACGFGRALLRNLLTFVDGFFSFLVGAMLVALTDDWQRLGDLAARTVVLADEKGA